MEFAEEKQIRILFVEDDEDTRQCFSVLFRSPVLKHCAVDFAPSVNEAMALIAMRVYDLCILDWQLRDGTARTLVNEWREFGYSLPFLVVSGDSMVAGSAIELGASAFLEKLDASKPDSLERAIRRALGTYWQSRWQ
jgi:DNA-binding NtrC family response regulator